MQAEGGEEVRTLQEAMLDATRALQMKAVMTRAEELHQDDPSEWPFLQAGECPTASTLFRAVPPQRVDFNLPEEYRPAVQRNQAVPLCALEPLQGLSLQTPISGDDSTRVDPYANNMSMGSLKEKDADGVTRTKCRCNLVGGDEAEPRRGGKLALALAAGGEDPAPGRAKGQPNKCKGMLSMECAQLEVPRRD